MLVSTRICWYCWVKHLDKCRPIYLCIAFWPPRHLITICGAFLKRGPIPFVLALKPPTPTQPNNAFIDTILLLLMTRIGWDGVDVGQVGDNFSAGEDWSGGDFLCARAPQIEDFLCARARTIVQRLTHVWIILLAYSCSTGHHALICAMPGLTSHSTHIF